MSDRSRMRRATLTVALAVAASIGGLARAGDEPTPWGLAADEVLAAAKAEDAAALARLAAREEPDPWLVADELLVRGERTVAEAFAKNAVPVESAALSAYVTKQAETPATVDEARWRTAVTQAIEAREGGSPDRGLAILDAASARKGSIVAVRSAFERGQALEALGKAEDATAAFAAAATEAEAIGWLRMATDGRIRAGGSEYGRAGHESALTHWRAAVATSRRRGDDRTVAGLLCNIGYVEQILGRPDAAITGLSEALSISERAADQASVGYTLGRLAFVYSEQGDVDRALAAYERAREVYDGLGDAASAGRALVGVGRMLMQRGDYGKANDGLARALDLAADMGDSTDRAWAAAALGRVRFALGDHANALTWVKGALS